MMHRSRNPGALLTAIGLALIAPSGLSTAQDLSRNTSAWADYSEQYLRSDVLPDLIASKYIRKNYPDAAPKLAALQVKIERRSAGLPEGCTYPGTFAFSDVTKTQITICSNNFAPFSDFLQEIFAISKYDNKYLNDDIIQDFFTYKAGRYLRNQRLMREKITLIYYGCHYQEFYYLKDTGQSISICDTPHKYSPDYITWKQAHLDFESAAKKQSQAKIYEIAKKNGYKGKTLSNILLREGTEKLMRLLLAHEIGHIISRDETDTFDTCTIVAQEMAADKFARTLLIEEDFDYKGEAAWTLMLWATYSELLNIPDIETSQIATVNSARAEIFLSIISSEMAADPSGRKQLESFLGTGLLDNLKTARQNLINDCAQHR